MSFAHFRWQDARCFASRTHSPGVVPLYDHELGERTSANVLHSGARPSFGHYRSRDNRLPVLFPSSVSHGLLLASYVSLGRSDFADSIWVFSGKNIWLTGFLLAGCLTTLGLDVTMSAQISKVPLVSSFGNFTPEVIAVFSIGAGSKRVNLSNWSRTKEYALQSMSLLQAFYATT